MMNEYSYIKYESLAQIRAVIADIYRSFFSIGLFLSAHPVRRALTSGLPADRQRLMGRELKQSPVYRRGLLAVGWGRKARSPGKDDLSWRREMRRNERCWLSLCSSCHTIIIRDVHAMSQTQTTYVLQCGPNSTTSISCRFVGQQVIHEAVLQHFDTLGCCGCVVGLWFDTDLCSGGDKAGRVHLCRVAGHHYFIQSFISLLPPNVKTHSPLHMTKTYYDYVTR